MPLPNILVLGGYGTFGRIVARELDSRQIPITVAGRNLQKAEQLATQLVESGSACRAMQLDAGDVGTLNNVLSQFCIVVNCAGPFSQFDATLLRACWEHRCHYVDIADDRRYAANVREFGQLFAARGLTAAYGCSSLPAISGAAAIAAAERIGGLSGGRIRHARSTLFIGNNNPKGAAAVRSTAELLGALIETPQGQILGLRDAQLVPLPEPFGPRYCVNFDSPDYDLMPQLLGVNSVSVKVGFELQLTTKLFQAFSFWPGLGKWTLPRLARVGTWLFPIGCSGGVVVTELVADESTVRAAVVARSDGQRMAALPAVYVAERLFHDVLNDNHAMQKLPVPTGSVTGYEALGSQTLLDMLAEDGFEVLVGF